MSRFNDFTDFDNKLYEDIDSLLEDSGVIADVFRRVSTSGAGFTKETGNESKVARILVYFTPAKSDYRMTGTPDLNIPKKIFIGITAHSDVRMRDVWRINGVRYTVTEVNKTPKQQVQVRLEA